MVRWSKTALALTDSPEFSTSAMMAQAFYSFGESIMESVEVIPLHGKQYLSRGQTRRHLRCTGNPLTLYIARSLLVEEEIESLRGFEWESAQAVTGRNYLSHAIIFQME